MCRKSRSFLGPVKPNHWTTRVSREQLGWLSRFWPNQERNRQQLNLARAPCPSKRRSTTVWGQLEKEFMARDLRPSRPTNQTAAVSNTEGPLYFLCSQCQTIFLSSYNCTNYRLVEQKQQVSNAVYITAVSNESCQTQRVHHADVIEDYSCHLYQHGFFWIKQW